MPFVTTLTLSSGDRPALEDVVSDIKTAAERKGVQIKGPQTPPPERFVAPQSKRLGPEGNRFTDWSFSVYTRTMRIVGHDEFARSAAGREFPDGVHIEVDVEQVTGAGRA
ncbi:uS10/mL48 family ribosomal protein [Halomarina oriensis]|uniref:Small ribosomal subunit protein uS10 n=1 Tax=Halomarina oriensis TaxID=671145 RepID=A0A6B0GP22_9EURY|nr:uS10/mL48 family ribosomal protein [Halomarina oriensis]MWG35267.1 30S ribosomal protein S10 [Halomarina oriensis]